MLSLKKISWQHFQYWDISFLGKVIFATFREKITHDPVNQPQTQRISPIWKYKLSNQMYKVCQK